tara:strand:+ start:3247 stop:3606 length:360 start_codon:yes stop_codon:yes gene_type:complete
MQRDLFGLADDHERDMELKSMYRRSDPVSSRMAAEETVGTGAANRQREQVLLAIEEFGPGTSAELADRSGIDRYALARRLPELAKRGLVTKGSTRVCRVSGRTAIEWERKENSNGVQLV